MKNIVLLCAAGMSTSLLVEKMKDAAQEINFDCKIEAYGVALAQQVVKSADIVLLGPQIRYELQKLKTMFPEKKIVPIDMRDYGTMNGKNVIAFAKKEMEN